MVPAARTEAGETKVLVVPVNHNPPVDAASALELPPAVKKHLGLDTARSRVVLSESNLFDGPGPDLRRVGDRDDSSVAYGFMPPKLFNEMRRRFIELETAAKSRRVQRTE